MLERAVRHAEMDGNPSPVGSMLQLYVIPDDRLFFFLFEQRSTALSLPTVLYLGHRL